MSTPTPERKWAVQHKIHTDEVCRAVVENERLSQLQFLAMIYKPIVADAYAKGLVEWEGYSPSEIEEKVRNTPPQYRAANRDALEYVANAYAEKRQRLDEEKQLLQDIDLLFSGQLTGPLISGISLERLIDRVKRGIIDFLPVADRSNLSLSNHRTSDIEYLWPRPSQVGQVEEKTVVPPQMSLNYGPIDISLHPQNPSSAIIDREIARDAKLRAYEKMEEEIARDAQSRVREQITFPGRMSTISITGGGEDEEEEEEDEKNQERLPAELIPDTSYQTYRYLQSLGYQLPTPLVSPAISSSSSSSTPFYTPFVPTSAPPPPLPLQSRDIRSLPPTYDFGLDFMPSSSSSSRQFVAAVPKRPSELAREEFARTFS